MKNIPLVLLVLIGCGGADSRISAPQTPDESAERWSQDRERPETVVPGASVRLADVITIDEVGKTFGVDDAHIPYPDTYWPFTEGGIAAQWNGSELSPLHKYMALTSPADSQAAFDWEQRQHGPLTPGVASWWGHCPGWTAAAMTNAPLSRGVDVRMAAGNLQTCTRGSNGCIHFEIGDINALAAEVYVDGLYTFIGARCDTAPKDIQRDASGRVLFAGCKGLNPGSMMVVLADRLKKQKKPIAINAQTPTNTDEIWNQPAYRYKVYRYQPLKKSEAVLRVSGKAGTSYIWNPDAVGFVFVDIGLQWIAENGPNKEFVSGELSRQETRFTAIIEIDAAGRIIGGEYLDDASVGTNRLRNAPFVWASEDSGFDNLPRTPDAGHNPYVNFSTVKRLMMLTR